MSASVLYAKAYVPKNMLLSNIFLFFFLYQGASGQSPSYVPTDPTVQCEEGWYQYNNKCFKTGGKHYNSFLTWDTARDRCVSMGGDLASVHSKEEQDPDLANPNPKYCLDYEGGGYKLKSSCLHYISTPMTWSAAEEFCHSKYRGSLVAVRDYAVHAFIDYILKEMKTLSPLWIGIKATNKKDPRYWSSGWYVLYERWIDGFSKDQLGDGTCVTRLRSGYWDVRPCERKYGFICEVSTKKAPKLKPSIEGSYCPTDPIWKDLGGDYCYYFNTETQISGLEANIECFRIGGTLASIHSREESDSIHQFVRYKQRLYLFIGYIRKSDDRFYWTDGSQASFELWQPGEPDHKIEYCTALRSDTMEWHDLLCTSFCGHICSVKKIPPNVTVSEESVVCSGELFNIK